MSVNLTKKGARLVTCMWEDLQKLDKMGRKAQFKYCIIIEYAHTVIGYYKDCSGRNEKILDSHTNWSRLKYTDLCKKYGFSSSFEE